MELYLPDGSLEGAKIGEAKRLIEERIGKPINLDQLPTVIYYSDSAGSHDYTITTDDFAYLEELMVGEEAGVDYADSTRKLRLPISKVSSGLILTGLEHHPNPNRRFASRRA